MDKPKSRKVPADLPEIQSATSYLSLQSNVSLVLNSNAVLSALSVSTLGKRITSPIYVIETRSCIISAGVYCF